MISQRARGWPTMYSGRVVNSSDHDRLVAVLGKLKEHVPLSCFQSIWLGGQVVNTYTGQ